MGTRDEETGRPEGGRESADGGERGAEEGTYWSAAMSRPVAPREADWEDDLGDRRGEDWGIEAAGTDEYEHAREGFGEFGVPSVEQGREVREQYSELDFAGRDERFAGRSGTSFAPGEYGGSAMGGTWQRREATPRPLPRREPPRIREGGRERSREREEAHAREIMTAGPKSVQPEATLRDVARIMKDENCGVVPVVDGDGRLVGLITDRDMVMRTVDAERPWSAIQAREVMTTDIEAVHPDESIHQIIHLMGTRQIRRVPVVERGDRLVGMVSIADVANRANQDEELQEALERISRRRSFWSRLWT